MLYGRRYVGRRYILLPKMTTMRPHLYLLGSAVSGRRDSATANLFSLEEVNFLDYTIF